MKTGTQSFNLTPNTKASCSFLAQHLTGVKTLIEQGPKGAAGAMAGIVGPLNTSCLKRFRNIGRKVYLLALVGNLPTEQEDKLRELGLLE